ncbi:coiled-coil and C2 domain-containing protein 2A-like isoform X3 [Lingula anatina]|uniref:Coiled-coil and C2 domain-containing protein 2A-like isoform X3 n=1 Tax=Lingula anatina TaxID=7574 RepID=A0A1S3JEY9_LINAN|nr:coiled-coil and C2 domain-containing protein 2A-like isoform X3 [Lingula anatina]|eukprot:XP_013408980.1 coiled-coil and C2 domain-containing protein 2A-like isoform X3 [Lingula anatina]
MSTIRERMRARRRALQESSSLLEDQGSDVEASPRRNRREKDEDIEMSSLNKSEETVEMLDEVRNAETLMDNLSKRRKEKQRELSRTLKTDEDVTRELHQAKKKSKAKISQSVRQEMEAEGEMSVEDEIEELGDAEEEPVEELTHGETPRSSAGPSPRRGFADSVSGTPGKSPRLDASLSLREKLRNKVLKAREQGESEALEDRPGRRLKGLRGKPLAGTRFDDPSLVGKEEQEAEAQLEKSRQAREKWKKAGQEVHKSLYPTVDEAYDFFTRNWDPEPEEVKRPLPTPREPTEGEAAEGEEEAQQPAEVTEEPQESSEEKALLEDYDDTGRNIVIVSAEYVPHQEKIQKEEAIYFVPSIIPIPPAEKIGDSAEPRYLEEEGLYVGTRPAVAITNQNKMEHRLLREPGKGSRWFGEDGKIIALPNPIKETPSRPHVPEDIPYMLQTDYRKAITKEFDSRYIDGSIEGKGRYQLDVDVNTLTLIHHHLFSREHVLATRLTQLYAQYIGRTKKNIVDYLTEKLRALKGAAAHLEENILNLKAKNSNVNISDLEQRLQDYRYEIKQTRNLRDTEQHSDRALLKSIIRTWQEIKSLRQLQNFTNTSVKLRIKKEEVNRAEDEEQWRRDMEEEVQELKEEKSREYDEKLALYQKQLEAFKQQLKAKKEAARRKKLRLKRVARAEQDQDENEAETFEQANKDDEILAQENLTKPEKPAKVTEANIREIVKEKAIRNKRSPGEPKLYPELTNTATITPTNQVPRAEQQRREDLGKYKMFVKVLFNNKEVSRTHVRPLNQEFRVSFAQIFNIQIMQWPQSVRLQVFESVGLSNSMLAEIYAAVPEATVTADTVQLEEMEFSSDITVTHVHEGVGSGIPFSFTADGSNPQSLMTTGILLMSVSWGVDTNGLPLVPPTSSNVNQAFSAMKGLDAVAAIGASAMVDMEKLSKWIAESRLDPNDPSNADLVYMMKPMKDGTGLQMPSYFRLEHLQEEFNFTTDEELDMHRRFRLIRLREEEVPLFKNKQIPALEKDIPQDAFLEYEKKEKEKEQLREDKDIESHRAAVAQFMQRVREQVLQRFRLAAHQKSFHDVVFEEEVPNIGTLAINLQQLGEPRRPLRPVRKERKKVSAQNVSEADVVINVQRAYDVPIRTDAVPKADGRGQRVKVPVTQILVRPFIEAVFQGISSKTPVADGPNPSWNYNIRLPFRPENGDFSPSNLQTIRDHLYLNLFDEVVTDMASNQATSGQEVHQRIEKNWLGSLYIPFSTLYQNSLEPHPNNKIDGTFRINSPSILLGYTHDGSRTSIDPTGAGGVEVGRGNAEDTYISLFITIEPQLSSPEHIREKFDSNEDPKLILAADAWIEALQKKFPKREYKTTVIDVNGKSVFITRYFKSLKPPDEILNQNTAPQAQAELVARYVSMIPFVSDSVVFPGLCDIWSTCDQFLQMLAGDEEEHAVLLCNYFLQLGKQAWLCLGTAIPEGGTAYVLTKEANGYLIWNGSTGESYSHTNPFCPLQSIGCLVNQENIWANVQPNDQPSRIDYDVHNTSSWRPFFNNSFPNPGLASIQPENLLYFPTDKNYVVDLQDKIERTVRQRFMEDWRPQSITRWNRLCQQTFRNLLPKMEETRGKGMGQQHASELESVLGAYKLSGFPLCMPFTEIQNIVESVHATGVWDNNNEGVEFALAVHIHAYPNSVLAVWVYVASLLRTR